MATRTHHSSQALQKIRDACDYANKDLAEDDERRVSYKKIITPAPTRWNSRCMMLESILYLRRPLTYIRDSPDPDMRRNFLAKASDERDSGMIIPEDDEFDQLEKYILPVLKVAQKVSTYFQGQNYPTSSMALVHLNRMLVTLDKISKNLIHPDGEDFAKAFTKELEKRIPHAGSYLDTLAYGHLLHPQFRGTLLTIFDKKEEMKGKLLQQDEDDITSVPETEDIPEGPIASTSSSSEELTSTCPFDEADILGFKTQYGDRWESELSKGLAIYKGQVHKYYC